MKALPIGLALSGGTAKSVTHVGVIKALAEADIPVSLVSGTSGGSIVATMYASGMPITTMEDVARAMSWRKLIAIKLTRLGFISSKRIEEFVRETIGDVCFEDLRMPCAVVVTNLVTGDKRVFRHGPVAPAVRASCSIPQVYLPVDIDGEYYVDGGLSEYLPVETARELGARFVIASHLGPVDRKYRRPHHILQLVMQITGLMAHRNYVISELQADVVVRPNLDHYSSFDFEHAGDMIELGYNTARQMIGTIREQYERCCGWKARLMTTLRGG